jgi:glycosyltransferase involved in cell wall biosynthesis
MSTAVSVIVSTYNSVTSLEKSLAGLVCQRASSFQTVIADDGSDGRTRALIERFAAETGLEAVHVWHEDRGFRKGRILNRAIQAASGDYLIFLDGDCIPRDDFVTAHLRLSRPGYFLAGGSHINIPESVQGAISVRDVTTQRVFEVRWLAARGVDVRRSGNRLARHPRLARLLDALTPRPGVFVGCNGSAWKADLLAVNGFDESFSYGSDDKELGVRLTNHGVRSRRHKYSLVCLHLAHGRSYYSQLKVCENKRRLKRLRHRGTTWTPHGIHPGPPPAALPPAARGRLSVT